MPLDKPVPPAGEELHLPGGSIQPLLLTIGITVLLLGVTSSMVLVVAGGLLTLAVLVRWVMDAKRDIDALPVHHHGDHH